MSKAVELFKCLGDETRYKIICQLYHSDSYVELLASKLGLTVGTVSFHLKKMEKAGLVKCARNQFYMIYSLNKDILNKTIGEFVAEEPLQSSDEAYREKVISSFFVYGRLIQIPVQKKKREIVISEILKDLEVGKEYSEKQVNELILKYHDDFCTIRRWFVDDGFMTRSQGIYTLIKK